MTPPTIIYDDDTMIEKGDKVDNILLKSRVRDIRWLLGSLPDGHCQLDAPQGYFLEHL